MTGFAGVDRGERGLGVRNHVLVLPSVICSHVVADRIAERVDEAKSAPHDHGCGQIGSDEAQTRRTYLGLAANPNVAGTVVVGLGCESVQSGEVAATLADREVPVREVAIQDAGGTEECVEAGVAAATELAGEAREASRREGSLSDLTLGIVSSDCRASSLDVAEPLVGEFAREVLDAGGRVLLAGIERFAAHPEESVATAGGASGDLHEILDARRGRSARATRVRREAADRAFEDLTRAWDGRPIREVIPYGERATLDSGVGLVNAPARFEEAATGLAAAGAQVVVHVTADGVPTGHPIVPVVKVTGDAETAAALPGDVDVDATGASSRDLREHALSVADGEPAAPEVHGLDAFAIARDGPSM